MKRIVARSWDELGGGHEDGDATFVRVDWTCPYCGCELDNEMLFLNVDGANLLRDEGAFEVDKVCDICNKMFTLVCD